MRLAFRPTGLPADGSSIVRYELRRVVPGDYQPPGESLPVVTVAENRGIAEGLEPGVEMVVGAATADGSYVAIGTRFALASGAQEQELAVEFLPAAEIEGVVLDADGTPVVGAEVRSFTSEVHPRPVRTDSRGRFLMRDVAGDAALGAHAPGRAPAYEFVQPGASRNAQVEFRLGRPWVLVGTAVDGRGSPIRGRLMAWTAGERSYAIPDAVGRFSFDHLPRHGRELVLEWTPAPGVAGRKHFAEPPSEGERLDLGLVQLDPSYLQEIQVAGSDGGALAGVMVVGRDVERASRLGPMVTDAAGIARFWLPEGEHEFSFQGLSESPTVTARVGGQRTPPRLTLTTDALVLVAGRVAYDGDGAPDLSEMGVTVTGPEELADRLPAAVDVAAVDGAAAARARFAVLVSLSSDGSFRFPLPRAWKELEIAVGTMPPPMTQDAGFVIARARVAASDAPIHVRASHENAMGLRVRVTDVKGAPVHGASITTLEMGAEYGALVGWRTGQDGRATVFPLAPGLLRVRAVAPDGRSGSRVDVEVVGPAWPEVVIAVE